MGKKATSLVLVAFWAVSLSAAQGQYSVNVGAEQDTFARAAVPEGTFGTAGLLSVSGAEATNGSGTVNGAFDSWMLFDFAAALAELDDHYGVGNWALTDISLQVEEFGEPVNHRFNHGPGDIEIRWVANDDWSIGSGSPSNPGTATGDQIGYDYGLSLLDSMSDQSLGVFGIDAAPGNRVFDLAFSSGLSQDLASGGLATLYLTAADPTVGFNFYSENNGFPHLVITAIPEPSALMLLLAGAAIAVRRR